MDLTEHHDLRGGSPVWEADADRRPASDPLPESADIAIVGAGIMGAMIAERLAGAGHRVALVDRRPPVQGATAASTALVLWEADVPLTHLAREIGEAEAARRWRRVHAAVARLAARIDQERLDGERRPCPSVYLAGDLLDEEGLRAEETMRARHKLPSTFLGVGAVADRFAIAARPALVSDDSYEVDPVDLACDLLRRARGAGATVTWPCEAQRFEETGGGVTLVTDQGPLRAGTLLLASGYERAQLLLPAAFSLVSSYAIATPPGHASAWRERAMLWEASDPYLYARGDAEGRIIAGGGDEDFTDADRRDALIGTKGGTIAAKLEALTGASIPVEHAWAAMFGSSPDGLPAIGRAQGYRNIWLAAGFGGNGVSFAALAAEIVSADLAGAPDPDAVCFDPYRFG